MEVNSSQKKDLPKVDLGPTSLVLIALIVTVCSGSEHRSDGETRKRIDELQQSVERLEKKVDALSAARQPTGDNRGRAPQPATRQP